MNDFYDELNEGNIQLRDKYQFELKSEYSPHAEKKENLYTSEFYIFVPASLQINPQTYSKEQFYYDQTNFIRLKTPRASLKDLYDTSSPGSPLSQIKAVAQQQNDETFKLVLNELKLYANIVRSALRKTISELLTQYKKKVLREEELQLMVEEIKRTRQAFFGLKKDLGPIWETKKGEVLWRYIDDFLSITIEQCEALVDLFFHCNGTIFFTGIGKSGLVAKKIAVTMVSTGTKSLYLSPINALHGDLGMVAKNDLFIFLSKSGESEELLGLIPHIRNKGAKPIAIVCEKENRLARACDLSVVLPMDRELCPFNLSPTTSASIQMIFGDSLCVALMQRRKFSLDDYAMNHPAGRIGKRATLRVADLMLKGNQLPVCHREQRLIDVLDIFSSKACGCLLIVDSEGKLEGIFTDGDLRRALQGHGSHVLEQKVEALMKPSPRFVGKDLLAWQAMEEMESDPKRPVTVLAVLDNGGRLIGLIKMHDILQAGI